MSSWSDELADALNECLAEFPAHILAPVGPNATPRTYPVCFDYRGAQTALDALAAATQPTTDVSFTMRRADFVAAGLRQESLIARSTTPSDVLHVTGSEDNPAVPFGRVHAHEMR